MKILLQINATANWGSTGRIAEQIGLEAMSRGWQSFIAYGRKKGHTELNPIKIGTYLGVFIHLVFARLCDAAGLGSYVATKRLIRKIKKIHPDVVHLHNIHGYYINYRLLFEFLNTSRIPIVWTFHDFWAITGHCAHFVEAKCDRWQTTCGNCPLIRKYPASLFDYSAKNHSLKKMMFSQCKDLHIVAVSDWVRECTLSSYMKDKSITVISNGVDLNIFRNEYKMPSFTRPENKFIILGVASQWKEGKGFEDFLRLSKFLKEDEVIVLLGVNDKQKSLLPENMIGLDLLNSQMELAEIYSAADVLLSLSYAETFGMTIVEAAACGTPAIVYDNTGQKSLVSEGTGLIVQTGDVASLYDAVEIIKVKGKSYYSTSCRVWAEKYFDKDICFKKYIDLYESLLDNSMKNK